MISARAVRIRDARGKKMKISNYIHNYQHKTSLSEKIFDAVKLVYENLSRDELLNHYLGFYAK